MATHRSISPVSDEPKPAKGLTPQQRQAVGIAVLVLCLLIGGGIIYLFMFGTSPKQRTVKVDPQQQTADIRGRGMPMPPRRQQFINKENDKTWVARGARGAMWVTYDGSNYKIEPFHPGRDFLTPDQVALVSGFVRARLDEAMAKEWGLSADQITKLQGMELRGSTMVVSDRERGELRGLWDAYMKAEQGQSKSEAEKKVIARLDELGKANIEASRKAFTQRLEQVKQVLTPQQIERIAGR